MRGEVVGRGKGEGEGKGGNWEQWRDGGPGKGE